MAWFEQNKRELPWRKPEISSFELLVAEVMLQRTRAETVAKYYYQVFNQYDSWEDIYNAGQKELEEILRPLGLYKQRAKRLGKLAKAMVEDYTELPITREELEKIPLIGQYIASAVMVYIHDKPEPLLDVNMARVIERFFGPRDLADIRHDPHLQKKSREIVNHDRFKEINWAVLDFAAAVCTKRNPNCPNCPLSEKCTYFSSKDNSKKDLN